jgi:probable rRNA maturation factor
VRPVPIVLRSRAAAVDRRLLRALVALCLDREAVPGEEGLGVVLAGDRLLRRLNREWRGLDRTTDVLSFPAGEAPPLPPEARSSWPVLRGEVVISLPRCLEQARERAEDPGVELARLVVHGALHCLGYDHETSRDRARMLPQERALRASAARRGLAAGLLRPTAAGTRAGSRT